MATTSSAWRCPARLYGPGLPTTGSPVGLFLLDGQLHIDGGLDASVPLDRVSVGKAGFDEAGLALSWSDGQGRWELQVLDCRHAAQILHDIPTSLRGEAAALRAQTVRRRIWRGLGWGALAAMLAVPLLALGIFFAFSDELAGFVAARVPMEEERNLGHAGLTRMLAQAKVRDGGESARAVREIGARLTSKSFYRYEFHVVEDAVVNAYALPGGFVVVHSGLIAATARPEELAAVLAHEVQHVELRHSLKNLVKQFGLVALWSLTTGDLGATVAGEAAQRMLGLSFSREAEREADEKGVTALLTAGIDPSGMPAFFGRLAAQGGRSLPGLLATHPSSADREHSLAELIRSLPAVQGLPLKYEPWPPRD